MIRTKIQHARSGAAARTRSGLNWDEALTKHHIPLQKWFTEDVINLLRSKLAERVGFSHVIHSMSLVFNEI